MHRETIRSIRDGKLPFVLALGAAVLLAPAGNLAPAARAEGPRSSGPRGPALAERVAELRREQNLVGLAAMVMVDGEIAAAAADGERKAGSGVPIELADRWHLGSVTKSITATMIGRLIESGKIRWSDTVGECFADASVHEDWKPVTLRQLLTHTGGAPADFPIAVLQKQPSFGREAARERRRAVLDVIAAAPAHTPGEEHAYSNVGYTIAGAMAEQVTGMPWQTLIQRGVYKPLKLTGAGFGPPKSSDQPIEQPQGHMSRQGEKVAVGEQADNTPIMGPAGAAHMTLEDLCRYTAQHLLGERSRNGLLTARTFKELHTPALDNYACGWVKNEGGAPDEPTLYWHNGSNTLWYALTVFIPEKNIVVAVTSNDGDLTRAEAAAWRIVTAELGEKAPPPGPEEAAENASDKIDPQRLVGRYQLNPNFIFDVRHNDGRMMVGITDQPTQQVFADTPTKWSYRSVDATLEFHVRGKGPAYALTLHQNGLKQRAKRLKEIDHQRLVGRYQLNPNFIFDVRYNDGRMMVGITNQPTQEVFADTPTTWSYRSVDARLEFHLRAKGPAHSLTLHQNGAEQRAKRLRD